MRTVTKDLGDVTITITTWEQSGVPCIQEQQQPRANKPPRVLYYVDPAGLTGLSDTSLNHWAARVWKNEQQFLRGVDELRRELHRA